MEVNCLKKGLECGGKRLQSWFWDQVTLAAVEMGDGTGFPLPATPLPQSILGCNVLRAGKGAGGEPGPSSSGQRSWRTPLSGKVCPRLGVRGLGARGPVCHPGLEMVRNIGRSGAPKDREVLSGQDKTP